MPVLRFVREDFAQISVEEQHATAFGLLASVLEHFIPRDGAGPCAEVRSIFEATLLFPQDDVDLLLNVADVRAARDLRDDERPNDLLMVDQQGNKFGRLGLHDVVGEVRNVKARLT